MTPIFVRMDVSAAGNAIQMIEDLCQMWHDIEERKAQLERDQSELRSRQIAFMQMFPQITSPIVIDGYRVIPRVHVKKSGERLSLDIFVRHFGDERGRLLWSKFQEPITVVQAPKPTLKHLKEVVGEEYDEIWNDDEICQRDSFLDIEEH